jgi:hypothetical protein
MRLHGALRTALGVVRVNGNMYVDTTLQSIDFIGHISTNQFQLGNLLGQKDLGNVAFDAHIDGTIDSLKLTHCIAEANIRNFDYLGYTYNHIHLDGEWNINEINGTVSINDDNLKLSIDGLADWDQEDTRIDVVESMLPRYNCGACGYGGCRDMAHGLLAKESQVSQCKPIKAEAKDALIKALDEMFKAEAAAAPSHH